MCSQVPRKFKQDKLPLSGMLLHTFGDLGTSSCSHERSLDTAPLHTQGQVESDRTHGVPIVIPNPLPAIGATTAVLFFEKFRESVRPKILEHISRYAVNLDVIVIRNVGPFSVGAGWSDGGLRRSWSGRWGLGYGSIEAIDHVPDGVDLSSRSLPSCYVPKVISCIRGSISPSDGKWTAVPKGEEISD